MLKRWTRPTFITLLVIAAATPAHAASLPADSTAIVSGTSSLFDPLPTPANESYITDEAVSADGRWIVFSSTSDGLVDGDDDRVENVYLKDADTGTVTLVSRAGDGQPSHGDCYEPVISDDGSRIAFTCAESLDPGLDKNNDEDVYLRDRGSGATLLVSRVGNLGAVANGGSSRPSIDETGTHVAFTSGATNLVPGASTPALRVYRRQIGGANETVLVSRTHNGDPAGGTEPSISDNGAAVAFASTGQLAQGDDNSLKDVYVRYVSGIPSTFLLSRASGAGAVGSNDSYEPVIAGSGNAVAFVSRAKNLDGTKDADSEPDIYRRSLIGSTTVLVSTAAAGKATYSASPTIDDSGNAVGFVAYGDKLHPDDTNAAGDAYVKDVVSGTITIATRASGAAGQVANANPRAVALSADGTRAVTELPAGGITPDTDRRHGTVIRRELVAPHATTTVARSAGTAPFVNQGGETEEAVLSADGRYVAFDSSAPGLDLPAAVERGVFVRDRVTGSVTLVSRGDGPDGTPHFLAFDPAISADGRRVAFSTTTNGGKGGGRSDVWVRDVAAGRTWLAHRGDGAGGGLGDGNAFRPALDADGSRVAFVSSSKNLHPKDADASEDVYVRDLDSDRTLLASDGGVSGFAKGDSYAPDIDAAGRRVAFVSTSKLLTSDDADATADAFVRDLQTGTTRLASATPDGVKADAQVLGHVSLDAAGDRVAFTSTAKTLGVPTGAAAAYVRDLGADTLTIASRADGPSGAPVTISGGEALLSPDGRYVAFRTADPALESKSEAPATQSLVRDLDAGRTRIVSRRDGASGAAATESSYPTDLSTNAGCVAFISSDGLSRGPASDYLQAFLRVLRADCASTDPPPNAGGRAGATSPGATTNSGTTRPVRASIGPDTVAPVLSRARLSRKRLTRRRGSVLTLRSSEAATLTLTIERVVRKRKGVRTPKPRAVTLTRRIAAGAVRIGLTTRVGKRRLAPGRYRLTLVARDAAGNRSRANRLTFSIAK